MVSIGPSWITFLPSGSLIQSHCKNLFLHVRKHTHKCQGLGHEHLWEAIFGLPYIASLYLKLSFLQWQQSKCQFFFVALAVRVYPTYICHSEQLKNWLELIHEIQGSSSYVLSFWESHLHNSVIMVDPNSVLRFFKPIRLWILY